MSKRYEWRVRRVMALQLLMLLTLGVAAEAQEWLWVSSGSNNARTTAVSHDVARNVYATGTYSGELAIGDTLLRSVGGRDIFVLCYDSDGNFLWGRSMGGPGDDVARDLDVDGLGNSWIIGSFGDSLRAGDSVVRASGGRDALVARLDAAGEPLLLRAFGSAGDDEAVACTTDVSGALYFTGWFSTRITFGTGTLSASGRRDVFVARILPEASSVGFARYGLPQAWAEGNAIALRGNGDLYIGGTFRDSILIGTTRLVAKPGRTEGFLLRVATAGSVATRWGVQIVGSDTIAVEAVSSAGTTVMVGGTFGDTLRIGGNAVVTNGGRDMFLAQLDTAGATLWQRGFGGVGNDVIMGIGVRRFNDYYVGGSFMRSIQIGDTTLNVAGGSDLVIFPVLAGQNIPWAARAGGPGNDELLDLDVDNSAFGVGGYTQADAMFGDTAVGANPSSLFVARFSEPRSLTFTLASREICTGAALDLTFDAEGFFEEENQFRAELSDAGGSFAMPTIIGVQPNASFRIIESRIPDTMPPGNGYRIRIVSTHPGLVSPDNGADITINSSPMPTITPQGPTSFCVGGSVILSAPEGYTSYRWSNFQTTREITVRFSGDFWVVVSGPNGCEGKSETITITELLPPVDPTITEMDGELISSAAESYRWFVDGDSIPGATGRTHRPTRSGNYIVEITGANGCTARSTPYAVTVASVEGMGDPEEGLDLSLSGDLLRLAAPRLASRDVEVMIIDLRGGAERRSAIRLDGEGSARIDVGDLPSGSYRLLLMRDGEKRGGSFVLVR